MTSLLMTTLWAVGDKLASQFIGFSVHISISVFRSYYYEINWPASSVLTFLCCKNQILNPPDYMEGHSYVMLNPPDYMMDTSSCKNGSGTAYISSPSCVDMEGHSYVMVDGDIINDVPNLCRINLIYSVPKNMRNKSYIDVHDILVYGFELSWFSFFCYYGKENRCNLDEATKQNNYCLQYNRLTVRSSTDSDGFKRLSIDSVCVRKKKMTVEEVEHVVRNHERPK